jgi:hypothetical protein
VGGDRIGVGSPLASFRPAISLTPGHRYPPVRRRSSTTVRGAEPHPRLAAHDTDTYGVATGSVLSDQHERAHPRNRRPPEDSTVPKAAGQTWQNRLVISASRDMSTSWSRVAPA